MSEQRFGHYKATRNEKGHLVVERVPIFVECKRGETHFSDDWIAAAVHKAKQAELEGYLPPLHIRHHEAGAHVEPAGFFRITGASPITFKGKIRTAIFADLVVTNPAVEEDVLAARLPYRSVEIFDVDDPAINSLALLDHEPPYLELPMLMIDEPAEDAYRQNGPQVERTSGTLVRVADATFANPWRSDSYTGGDPVVACFRRGHSAHLFFEDSPSMTITTSTKAQPTPAKAQRFGYDEKTMADDDGEKMADDDGEKMTDDDGEEMVDGAGMDVDAVCTAIRDGSISVAQMEQIKAAIVEQMNSVGAEGEGEEAAPAPTPGEAMKNGTPAGAHFAAMQAKIDAQEAKLAQMAHDAERKAAVDVALERLEGRPLGADPAGKFSRRFDELGAEGFKLYVDDLAGMFGALPSGAGAKAAAFAGQTAAAPESALAYTEQGAEAVERAAKFAAEHRELAARGMTRHGEEAYVRSNMARAGFRAPK